MRDEQVSGCVAWFKEVTDAIPSGWIAGGAVRDYFARMHTASDIDVFFPSVEAYKEGKKSLTKARWKVIYSHEHVDGYSRNNRHVQLIKTHFFPDADSTIAAFDFTVCCAAVTPSGSVLHHEHFFEDLSGRRLAINSLPFPLSTLERLQKYVEKGFRACNGTLMQIAKAIQELDLENPSANTLTFYPNGQRRFTRFD